jgi:hypothetical protein
MVAMAPTGQPPVGPREHPNDKRRPSPQPPQHPVNGQPNLPDVRPMPPSRPPTTNGKPTARPTSNLGLMGRPAKAPNVAPKPPTHAPLTKTSPTAPRPAPATR